MALVLYIAAGLVVLAGLAFAALAPTEFMGAREAFFARLVLAGPATLVGLILAAFAAILMSLKRLERATRDLAALARGVPAPVTVTDEPAPMPYEPRLHAPSAPAVSAPAAGPDAAVATGIGAAGLAAALGVAAARPAAAQDAAPAETPPAPVAPQPVAPAAEAWPELHPVPAAEEHAPEHAAPAAEEWRAPEETTAWQEPEPATAVQWPDLAAPTPAEPEPEAEPAYDPDSQAARVAAALEAVLIADRAADERVGEEQPVDEDRLPEIDEPDLDLEPRTPERRIEPILRMEDLIGDPEPSVTEQRQGWFEAPPAAEPPRQELADEEPARSEPAPPRPWFETLPQAPVAEPPAEPAPEPEPEPAYAEPQAVALPPEPVPVPMPAPAPTAAPFVPRAPETAELGRAPTVAEILARGNDEPTAEEPAPRIVREGQFAGRRYRMFENGSLEIDTDQSTIRFGSLDEFRAFVAAASKKQPEPTS